MNKKQRDINVEAKELSLEEIDLLCRKCHHMHDEEVWRIISRFFSRLKKYPGSEGQHAYHSSAR